MDLVSLTCLPKGTILSGITCFIKRRDIFKKLHSVASPKLSKIFAVMMLYKKRSVMKPFCEKLKTSKLINKLPTYDTCEGVYCQVKLRSEVPIRSFQKKKLTTAGAHFIPEHISFSSF